MTFTRRALQLTALLSTLWCAFPVFAEDGVTDKELHIGQVVP
jgi:hypothetical protein